MLEITDKISSYLKKNNLANFLKLCIILISLFLIVRLFTKNTTSTQNVENFMDTLSSRDKFGNEIGYIKSSTGNSEYTFKLDETVQLDTIFFESTTSMPTFKYLDSNNNVKLFSNLNIESADNNNNIFSGITPNIKDIDGNKIITDTIIVSSPVGFLIKKIEFYGTKIGMINREGFNNTLAPLYKTSFLKQTNSTNIFINRNSSSNASKDNDTFINSISFTMSSNTPPMGIQSVKYNIYYYNNIYPGTKFTISNNFKIRVDSESNYNKDGTRTTAYLYKPIIANKIMIELEPVVNFNVSLATDISVTGKEATNEEKNIFKVNNQNVIDTTTESADSSNVCPTMDEIMDKQTKAQQICDNIEYQDKIKSEKIRLEKNRQYLLKLKTQEEQIDQLNNLISGLQSKRESRDKNNDMLRVAQYQKQREESSVVRDLANERLQSQDQNKLFFNVKVNAI